MPIRDMEQSVTDWVKEADATAAREGYASVHIDELIGKLKKSEWIPNSCHAFEILIDKTLSGVERLMPFLRIALTDSDLLDIVVPTRISLLQQLPSQPPSLYLIDRTVANRAIYMERYLMPVSELLDFQIHNDGIFTYYEVWRSQNEVEREVNEYARNIIAAYYPPALFPQR